MTQGSQSLALGLTLTAAPQLVAGSRLMRHDHRLLSYAPLRIKYIIPDVSDGFASRLPSHSHRA